MGDTYADDGHGLHRGDQPVSGVADTWDQELRGSVQPAPPAEGQHPNLKIPVVVRRLDLVRAASVETATEPGRVRPSPCYNLVEEPALGRRLRRHRHRLGVPERLRPDLRHLRVPPRCKGLTRALRSTSSAPTTLVTVRHHRRRLGGRQDSTTTDYAGAAQSLDWYNVDDLRLLRRLGRAGVRRAPHSPLTSYAGIPQAGFDSADAIAKLKAHGRARPRSSCSGIGFYGPRLDGRHAEGARAARRRVPPPARTSRASSDYKELKTKVPRRTARSAGTAYAYCGPTGGATTPPATIGAKMSWAKSAEPGRRVLLGVLRRHGQR